MASLDVYSETNPVFLSLLLWHFLYAHDEATPAGCDLASLYLAIPISASEELRDTFNRTQKNTGLFTWLRRNPRLPLSMSDRISRAHYHSASAIRFAAVSGLITVADTGSFHAGPQSLFRKNPTYPASDARGAAFRRASKLGSWIGRIGSTEMVFNALRLSI
ncbi:three component ABC system middle component [Halomonadaceae bacterium KBTZ08]